MQKNGYFGSALSCFFGFALLLAANEGIFYPNNLYKYESKGVFLKNEPEDIFEQFEKICEFEVHCQNYYARGSRGTDSGFY